MKELQQHVLELVDNNYELSQALELLLSIVSVGETSAIYIMGEILILPKNMTVKQWVAHAGLDPREFTSGTSVNKQPRLTYSWQSAYKAVRYSCLL
ncbi:transposase [Candidatus Halobeggiatoa sp. HSG11]|nr:transposase [Candidatus Halobeggiatoa sp. HSG11]